MNPTIQNSNGSSSVIFLTDRELQTTVGGDGAGPTDAQLWAYQIQSSIAASQAMANFAGIAQQGYPPSFFY